MTFQAIFTKFIPPTNYRGSRIKAWCDAGSIVVSADHGDSIEGRHRHAVAALCDKLNAENRARHGESRDVWRIDSMVCGGAPQKSCAAYVYVTP